MEEASLMMYFILYESLRQLQEPCEWDGDDMCSCVIKYVGVGSLDLGNGLRYVDVFI